MAIGDYDGGVDPAKPAAPVAALPTSTDYDNVNKDISNVGIRLLKFCTTFDLVKISEQIQSYAEPLNARYTK